MIHRCLPGVWVPLCRERGGAELKCSLPRVNTQLSKSLPLSICSRWHFVLTWKTAGQVQSPGRGEKEVFPPANELQRNSPSVGGCSGVYTSFSECRWNALRFPPALTFPSSLLMWTALSQ